MTLLDAMMNTGGLSVLNQNLWRQFNYTAVGDITGERLVRGAVEPESVTAKEDDVGTDWVHMRRITLGTDQLHAVYPGVSNPRVNDTVNIDSVLYTVSRIVGRTAAYTTLECVRPMAHEVARGGFRGAR